jgi:beta-glucuronidase
MKARMWLAIAAAAIIALASGAAGQPFYPHYPARTVRVLDGTWSYGFGANFDLARANPAAVPTPSVIAVPVAFDHAPPGIQGPRGTAFFRTTFPATPGHDVLLSFQACSFYCKVFVDNQLVGDHRAGGYVPFWLTVKASAAATRELLVLADNRFNATTAPLHIGEGSDFVFHGGILRSVIVHEVPTSASTWIRRVEVRTTDLVSRTVTLRVLLGGVPVRSVDLAVAFDDKTNATMY